MPDQGNSMYKGLGDGGTKNALVPEAGLGVAERRGIGKVIRGKHTQGLSFCWDFVLYYKKQGKPQMSFNWED